MSDYPEMTAEEYRKQIAEVLERVESACILRYFYIFINEKLKKYIGKVAQRHVESI